jgi:hypothetical protein
MGDALSIVAIVGLLVLVAISVRKQRLVMTHTRADERARTDGDDVQRQRSLARRADVRAAAHPDR